jgi:hypothetical protein
VRCAAAVQLRRHASAKQRIRERWMQIACHGDAATLWCWCGCRSRICRPGLLADLVDRAVTADHAQPVFKFAQKIGLERRWHDATQLLRGSRTVAAE